MKHEPGPDGRRRTVYAKTRGGVELGRRELKQSIVEGGDLVTRDMEFSTLVAVFLDTGRPGRSNLAQGVQSRRSLYYQNRPILLKSNRPLLTSGDGLVKASFDARSREVSQEKHADFCARLVSLGCQSVKSETRR